MTNEIVPEEASIAKNADYIKAVEAAKAIVRPRVLCLT